MRKEEGDKQKQERGRNNNPVSWVMGKCADVKLSITMMLELHRKAHGPPVDEGAGGPC